MKKLLFILLVFISFQGFSQYAETVKIKELGIEWIEADIQMTWNEANLMLERYNAYYKELDKSSNEWRLPTIDELHKIYKTEYAGSFKKSNYWSSTKIESSTGGPYFFHFGSGFSSTTYYTTVAYYVRIVRTLK
jgi:hypothetical protein